MKVLVSFYLQRTNTKKLNVGGGGGVEEGGGGGGGGGVPGEQEATFGPLKNICPYPLNNLAKTDPAILLAHPWLYRPYRRIMILFIIAL